MTNGPAQPIETRQFREFAGEVVRQLPNDLGGIVTQYWISHGDKLRQVLREALEKGVHPAVASGLVKEAVTVNASINYDLPVSSKAERFSDPRHDLSISQLNEATPPMAGPQDREATFLSFGREMGLEGVLARMGKLGYRPGVATELLDVVLPGKWPAELSGGLAIAIGDCIKSESEVQFLYVTGFGTQLEVASRPVSGAGLAMTFHQGYCFLAFPM